MSRMIRMMRRMIAWAASFLRSPLTRAAAPPARLRTLLVTGAAGHVASCLRPGLREMFPRLRLVDIRPVANLAPVEEFMRADLSAPGVAERAVAGVDAIVHLAAVAKEAPFEMLHDANIIATYNLFEAARRQGVRRIVFTSTMHVMGFYRRDEPFDEQSPLRPDSRYAVSKAFGEALARLYADKHGLRVVCLRIGHLMPTEDEAEPGNWASPEDLLSLVRIGLEHPDLRFEVFHVIANYEGAPVRMSSATRYGFVPRRATETFARTLARARSAWPSDSVAQMSQGATFASAEYSGAPHELPVDLKTNS